MEPEKETADTICALCSAGSEFKSDLHVLRLGALKALKRVFFLFSDPTAKSQSANLVARQLMCEKHGGMCDVN